MLNRESLKKRDYARKLSKPELSNLKRMPKSSKTRLCSTTQLPKVRSHRNSTPNQKTTLNLTKPPISLCLLKMML
jgi:hypothetical protein